MNSIVRHFMGFQGYQDLHVNLEILSHKLVISDPLKEAFECEGIPDGCTTGIVVEVRVHLRNLSAPALNPVRPNFQLCF